ncbi:MAG: anaerobic sulfatase-maturation protein [Muribaculaceae bacterium]|nr:anaerobic sulfatase-maturation protein [Muribaculaceae bacterium]
MNEQSFYPTPFGYPVYIMAKPAGPGCNLACEYCYYLEKNGLFENRGAKNMSDATLERYIRTYIESQSLPSVQFTWHGGEAMLRPLDFYRKAMDLQRRYAGGRHIENCLQTNGTLLTEEWCRFLRDNGWLVGVSIDGPQEFHDEYRRTRDHRPSFMKVMRGIRMLQRYGVEWNALAVVNDYNADFPDDFYNFFKEIDCQYIQFTPVVERLRDSGALAHVAAEGTLAPFSVTPRQWGDFLCRIFDLWVREDVGRVFVQIFDATLANYMGVEPGLCTLAKNCGHAGVMEHNGDVYSCDHFVFPEYYLGNIHSSSAVELMYSPRQIAFGQAKSQSLPQQCRACRHLSLCHGECPRNRFAITADDEAGLNYLCEGYRQFFDHSAPYFRFMAEELRNERPPSNVMEAIRRGILP